MPEEVNRRLIDTEDDVLYVTETAGLSNLTREGVPDHRAVLVGYVMIDSLLAVRDLAGRSRVLEELGLSGPFGVVTLHRSGNVDDPETQRRLVGTQEELAILLP